IKAQREPAVTIQTEVLNGIQESSTGSVLGTTGDLISTDLTKVYRRAAERRALDTVSMKIPSRGIFALIGRNGAGKTTLVRILATQLEPSSGAASINGMDVMKDAGKLRERIAIVPQEARTLPWLTAG